MLNSTADRSGFQWASGGKRKNNCDLLEAKVSCSGIVLKCPGLRGPAWQRFRGERIAGGFILITALYGIRYAIRPQSVGIIHDAAECRDETIVQLHGGHLVRAPCSLDQVLAWFRVVLI